MNSVFSIIKGGGFIVLAFMVLTISSCIEEFQTDLDDFESLLVIDGRISTEPGPYQIKLSKASSIQKTIFLPQKGATVIISDDKGNSETLKEIGDGVYETAADGIKGVVGNTYQLKITTADGQYESEPEKMAAAMPIKNVYEEPETRFSVDQIKSGGFQFYIDTDAEGSDTPYFLWDLETTYKYTVDFQVPFVYNGSIVPFINPDSFFTCWKTEKIRDIYTFDISNLSEPKIERLPLNFADVNTRQLQLRYSLLVKQYSVSKEAFDYWSALQEQNDNQGSLYSSLPYQIRGNIKNIANPDEAVLGYFMAAGVSEKRIYANPYLGAFNYGICQYADPAAAQWDIRALRWTNRGRWPILLTQSPAGVLEVPLAECVDCRSVGGTIYKPSWWVE